MENSPKLSHKTEVYRDQYRYIYRVSANFGTFSKEYLVTDSGERAGIVIVKDGLVLLVRQYRFLIDRLSWEVPGGRIDEGETPIQAAARECLEETGLACNNLETLVMYYAGLDSFRNIIHLFYTDEFERQKEYHANPEEVVSMEWVPLDRCIQMIFDGTILDSMTIIALLAYQQSTVQRGKTRRDGKI